MRNLIFLVYYLPPDGGAGPIRTAKMARYLPEFGWRPHLVAPLPEHDLSDPHLQEEIEGVPVYRIRGFQPQRLWRRRRSEGSASSKTVSGSPRAGDGGGVGRAVRSWIRRYLFVPDEAVFWAPAGARACEDLSRVTGASAILATQPNSLLLAGAAAGRTTGLPFVAELRDEWVARHPSDDRPLLRRWLERPLEAQVVRRAEAVLCNTPGMVRGFRERYPGVDTMFPHSPNGWDPADFPADAPCHLESCPRLGPADRPLEVVYAGAFYGDYNPLTFLRGLARAVDEELVPPGGVQVRLYGSHDRAVRAAVARLVSEAGIEEMVHAPGPIPHRRAVRALLEADLLLLVMPPGPSSDTRITAKTYEILAAGRPVLAMLPPGDARQLVVDSGAAWAVLDVADEEGAARALGRAHRALREGTLQAATRWDLVGRYTRRRIAGDLARLLDSIVEARG